MVQLVITLIICYLIIKLVLKSIIFILDEHIEILEELNCKQQNNKHV